ncbi:hypothetical protein [Bradyrhizobium sp.]|uniref:hypothetical protein n=1 Tax=Bradyrhizobium sp. TaxID=376 RepID=UPI0023901AD7|nr:hypothetical protein [Bradyrhizobium sp.]MDE1932923.1 hypothetical protein [Bradyrhizobium sp.]
MIEKRSNRIGTSALLAALNARFEPTFPKGRDARKGYCASQVRHAELAGGGPLTRRPLDDGEAPDTFAGRKTREPSREENELQAG